MSFTGIPGLFRTSSINSSLPYEVLFGKAFLNQATTSNKLSARMNRFKAKSQEILSGPLYESPGRPFMGICDIFSCSQSMLYSSSMDN